jgi:hypothetical protein
MHVRHGPTFLLEHVQKWPQSVTPSRAVSTGTTLEEHQLHTEAQRMRFSLLEPEFGWGEKDEAGPQTADSRERGFVREVDEDKLGHSESLDEDEVGDIADEGPGRRG